MHKEKFMIYRRDAKKGEATYSPKSRPLRRGHGRMDIVVLLQQEG